MLLKRPQTYTAKRTFGLVNNYRARARHVGVSHRGADQVAFLRGRCADTGYPRRGVHLTTRPSPHRSTISVPLPVSCTCRLEYARLTIYFVRTPYSRCHVACTQQCLWFMRCTRPNMYTCVVIYVHVTNKSAETLYIIGGSEMTNRRWSLGTCTWKRASSVSDTRSRSGVRVRVCE